MIEILSSRNGADTAKLNDIFFHSSYDPCKEANRICEKEGLYSAGTVILIEPGLNHIASSIRSHQPETLIVSIYTQEIFFDRDCGKSDHTFLFKNDKTDLKQFLSSTVTEFDLEKLKYYALPASYKIDKTKIEVIQQQLLQHIRETHGNIATISGFGKKQFRNFIRNIINIPQFYDLKPIDSTVLIAGSGPGLFNSIDFIKRNREQLFIITLPSSLLFLNDCGIEPDIIISTDPGYYAGLHLINAQCPVAAPVTAYLPSSTLEKNDIVIFSQDYFIEKEISEFLTVPAIKSHGTVAGSALFLSLLITTGPVIITGLDFLYRDILSHVRPHTFDILLESCSTRTDTMNSIYFERNIEGSCRLTGRSRTTGALKAYSGWFSENSTRYNGRCFFLETDSAPPGSFRSLSHPEAESLISNYKKTESGLNRSNPGTEKNQILEILLGFKKHLKDLRSSVTCSDNFNDIFSMLNNELLFNICLGELIEFRHYFKHKSGKDVSLSAVSIINKADIFLSECLQHVQ